ncbi:MAG: pyridoxamine 5'-phosphate oxidase family protein, partial [Thermomicrobiales bacterium]|nr:pyridoxamine 5'-phosphate oxidase family protein [Thermomicrobiales bacterium]
MSLQTDPEAPAAFRRTAAPGDLAFVRDRRVGHLATADAAGTPSVVPVCYALVDVQGATAVAIALDEKPKGEPHALQRVRNILARPEVSL